MYTQLRRFGAQISNPVLLLVAALLAGLALLAWIFFRALS